MRGLSRPLRVGLFVDAYVQPAWVHRIVEQIQTSGFAEVVLVVENQSDVGGGALSRLRERPDLFLYWLYTKADELLFRQRPRAGRARIQAPAESSLQDPFALADLTPLLVDVARLGVTPRQTKFSDFIADDDIAAIRAYDLDVALRFGFRILRGAVLQVASGGVWSFHHADNRQNRGGPAGFWEVFEGAPVTGSMLQVLTEGLDDGVVLSRTYARTDPFSVARNRANYFFTAGEAVIRQLRILHREGTTPPDTSPTVSEFAPYSNRLYVRPGNREMARLLLTHGVRVAAERMDHHARSAQWLLAYELSSGIPSMHRFRYLEPPSDRFWADPFPVAREDGFHIFCEEFVESKGRGHISVIEMDRRGVWSPPEPVLEQPHHLSYPFVFQWQGERFMVPEAAATGRVELYRCLEYPHNWELQQVLLEGVRAVDATLYEAGGRWWMFATVPVEGSVALDEELHLFIADRPDGPWRPHRANPVKSDVRSSRPAGRLFEWGGNLYRPSQDGSNRYGSAIVFNRVLRLDHDGFREEPVARIDPNWDRRLLATHTYNAVPGLTVVDALRRRPLLGNRRSGSSPARS